MNRKAKLPAVSVSRRIALDVNGGAEVTWEYRFADTDESLSPATGTHPEGWIVVSSSTRRDNSREFLLKRPLR